MDVDQENAAIARAKRILLQRAGARNRIGTDLVAVVVKEYGLHKNIVDAALNALEEHPSGAPESGPFAMAK